MTSEHDPNTQPTTTAGVVITSNLPYQLTAGITRILSHPHPPVGVQAA